MFVENVAINIGSSPMESGFLNQRLPKNLGCFTREDQSFGFGIQVSFRLNGINVNETELKINRKVISQVEYKEPNLALAKLNPSLKDVKNGTPDQTDCPSEQNVKRDQQKSTIIVFDGPGPSNRIIVGDPQYYPIKFEARFNLTLQYLNVEIAGAEFYFQIEKKNLTPRSFTDMFDTTNVKLWRASEINKQGNSITITKKKEAMAILSV